MDGLKCFKKIGLIVLCLGVAASFVCADGDDDSQELKISLSQAPELVRATIKKHAEGKEIEVIEVEVEDGKLVYNVEIENKGEKTEFKVSSDGRFLGFDEENGSENDGEKDHEIQIDIERLPSSVKEAAKNYFVDGAETKAVEEKEDGVLYYEIEMEKGELSKSVKFTKEGALVEVEGELEISDLPEAVRLTIEKKFSNSEIEEIVSVQAFFYEIVVSKDGKEIEIPISPAGILMKSQCKEHQVDKKKKEDEDEDDDNEN